MVYAPIIVFVYNRPDHTRRTLSFLGKNFLASESDVFILADGLKENATKEQINKVQETRKVIRENYGFKSVTITEAERNKGLAPSVIAGVTEIVNQFGRCIVVEDDLETSPYFLTYMNDALEVYKDTENVACIHGFMYEHSEKLPETFFIKGADCWGWATWKRAWDKFNPNGQELLDELHRRNCEKHFNFNNTYNYIGMLEEQISGRNSSWAIRWQASAYLNDMYCLYPSVSLVKNIGLDNSGTHCFNFDYRANFESCIPVNVIWQEPKQCSIGWNCIRKALRKPKDMLWHFKKIYRKAKKYVFKTTL